MPAIPTSSEVVFFLDAAKKPLAPATGRELEGSPAWAAAPAVAASSPSAASPVATLQSAPADGMPAGKAPTRSVPDLVDTPANSTPSSNATVPLTTAHDVCGASFAATMAPERPAASMTSVPTLTSAVARNAAFTSSESLRPTVPVGAPAAAPTLDGACTPAIEAPTKPAAKTVVALEAARGLRDLSRASRETETRAEALLSQGVLDAIMYTIGTSSSGSCFSERSTPAVAEQAAAPAARPPRL